MAFNVAVWRSCRAFCEGRSYFSWWSYLLECQIKRKLEYLELSSFQSNILKMFYIIYLHITFIFRKLPRSVAMVSWLYLQILGRILDFFQSEAFQDLWYCNYHSLFICYFLNFCNQATCWAVLLSLQQQGIHTNVFWWLFNRCCIMRLAINKGLPRYVQLNMSSSHNVNLFLIPLLGSCKGPSWSFLNITH